MAGTRTPSERDEEQCEGSSDGSGGAVAVVNDGAPRLPLEALLTEAQACPESRSWAVPYGTDYERAWNECPNAEWLLHMARICGVDAGTIARGCVQSARVLESELDSHSHLDVRAWLNKALEAAKSGDPRTFSEIGCRLVDAFALEDTWSYLVMRNIGHTFKMLSTPKYMNLGWRINLAITVLFTELLIGEGPDTYRRIANAVREEISFTQVLEAYRASSAAIP